MTTPRARALAKELRAARTAAKLSQVEVAEVLGWSKHKASRMELAKFTPSQSDLGVILDKLGIQGKDRDRLMKFAREVEDRAWWEFGLDFPAQFTALVAAEDHATRITQSAINLIPGLLQIRDYSRALISRHPEVSNDTERRVSVRLMRQGILSRPDPVEFTAYLDEGCLVRPVGSPKVMTEQLRELQRIAEMPNVAIRIMPFAQGPHASMNGGFELLDFVRDESMVHLEQLRTAGILSGWEDVQPFKDAAGLLRESALSEPDSLTIIADYMKKYECESE